MLWSVIFLGLLGLSRGGQIVNMQLTNDWGGRFQGDFHIPIKEDVDGWEAILTFSKPISNINLSAWEWIGDVISHSANNTIFTIVDKPHVAIQMTGADLHIQLFAEYQGTGAPSATAEFINLGHDPFVPPSAKPDSNATKYNLNEILQKSILFYEAQRSGKLPADNRIPWRGDSALNDSGANGEDLTGGWYDAGDHVKFNFPMAFSVTSLAWGLLEFKDAYEDAGELNHMYGCIKWPLDYLLKCHVAKDTLYAQVGNGGLDHAYWGRPENMTMARPAYKIDPTNPGSDLAGETAAAFAASSLVFKHKDAAYANTLLQHAKDLFDFAVKYPGKYSDSVADAAAYYRSYQYEDELCWGGAWLYMATQEEKYLTIAEANYVPGSAWGQSWDEKASGCMVLLYKITHKDKYLGDIELTFTDWMPGGTIQYTPKGLAWRSQWGSNRYSANMALIAIMAAEQGIHPTQYRQWAESQINYILGDNGRSYVVGFGNNPPTQPHHRGSSCPMGPAPCASFQMNVQAPNPHVLYGALVGGPGQGDDYTDSRTDYVKNEVACDYNAGFQSAVAGIKSLYMRGDLP